MEIMTLYSNSALLTAAGVLHLTQPLVMAFAPKYMDDWQTNGEVGRVNRLARRVMQVTLRGSMLVLTVLVIAHFEEAVTLRLGRCLFALWASLATWMLVGRLRRSPDDVAFRRERGQILFVVTTLGMVVLGNAEQAATTPLGVALVSGLWLLWSTRAFIELFVYRRAYPKRRIMKLWNVVGGCLFLTQSTLYGAVRVRISVVPSPMISKSYASFAVNIIQETAAGRRCDNALREGSIRGAERRADRSVGGRVHHDVISLVEAAYRVEPEANAAWLSDLVETAFPHLDAGLGMVGFLYKTANGGAEVSDCVSKETPAGFVEALRRANQEITPRAAAALYSRGPVGTASEQLGSLMSTETAFRDHFGPLGVNDFQAVLSTDPSGEGCLLGVPLKQVTTLDMLRKKRWARVAAHLAAAYRIRRLVAKLVGALGEGAPTVPHAAVLDPDGSLQHAEPRAQVSRERLRQGVLAMERARSRRLRSSDPDESLSLWQALLDGQYSLVDHFDSDGRRYVLAVRNPPEGAKLRGLTPRERQVAGLIGLGHSLDEIAYQLGITSKSLVSRAQTVVLRKLGLKSRTELCKLFGFA
jgi:DNA-binding CsgD family transcriptional regulator